MSNDRIVISSKNREPYSSNKARKLIREGMIPAVVYGPDESIPISLNRSEFEKVFYKVGEHIILSLDTESNGEKRVIIKDYQIDPVKKTLIHVDLLMVDDNRPIKTKVPIKIVGNPKGVKLGGIFEQYITSIRIKTLPSKLPEAFEVNVSELGILDSTRVRDLEIPEGVDILNPPTQTIASVVTSRVAKEAARAEEKEAAKAEK